MADSDPRSMPLARHQVETRKCRQGPGFVPEEATKTSLNSQAAALSYLEEIADLKQLVP